jgi:dihydropteroate synthase
MVRALDFGVDLINNVCSVLLPVDVLNKISSCDAAYLGMHIHLSPQSMQKEPLNYSQAFFEVEKFFANTSNYLQENGLDPSQIWLDPGIGFGKDDSANLNLLAQTSSFSKKYNIALGVSRKSFLTRIFAANSLSERDLASKALEFGLIASGAKIIRTHTVFKKLFKVCFTNAAN